MGKAKKSAWEVDDANLVAYEKPITEPARVEGIEESRAASGIKIMVDGPHKIGKSIFATSSVFLEAQEVASFVPIPDGHPVVVIDTEMSAHWLGKFYEQEMAAGRLSFRDVYAVHPETQEVDIVKSFEKFWATLLELKDMTSGTVIIDSLSDIHGWLNSYLRIKILHISKEDQIMPSQWFWRNDKWESLMKLLRSMKCNVIVTCKTKEEWGVTMLPGQDAPKLQKTGVLIPICHQTTPYWFDVIMQMRFKYDEEGIPVRVAYINGARAGVQANTEIEKPNVQKVVNVIRNASPELDWGNGTTD